MAENRELALVLKLCADCQQAKPVQEFPGHANARDGYGLRCLPCKRARMFGGVPTEARCTACGAVKPLSAFYRLKRSANGRRSACKTCADSHKANWYKNTLALRRATEKRYRVKHRDGILEWAKEYHRTHAEQRSAYMRRFRQAHPGYWSAWLQRNLLRARLQSQKRRAIERNAPGKHSLHDVAVLLQMQGGLCAYCRTDLNEKFELDYIVPISRGGSNWPTNLACACKTCNRLKSNRLDWVPVLDCFNVSMVAHG